MTLAVDGTAGLAGENLPTAASAAGAAAAWVVSRPIGCRQYQSLGIAPDRAAHA